MYQTTLQGWKQPTAYIAVNRNRLKHYGEKVYLKDGTHFELELFNPKQTKVLAKIYLNGQPVSSSGIVLRPGQRVFLERWLDEAKKFLFETYEVDNSKEAVEAVEKNGKVRIEFYDEIVPQSNTNWSDQRYLYNTSGTVYPPFGGTTVTCLYSSTPTGSFTVGSNSLNAATMDSFSLSNSIETGRAEKGEISNQSFVQDSSSYSSWCSKSYDLQILPESAKPVEAQNIRNYCSNCGTRMKNQNWKFCPSCGTKL